MAIRFYDEAVCDKIKRWVKDPNMRILSPADSTRLFQLKADESGDKQLTLPLIALSRDSDFEIISTAKKPLSYDGPHVAANIEQSELLCGIPIKLTYQLDIYTKYFNEADEYVRNFIFNLINYPTVSIEIPYNNAKIDHESMISLGTTISDNSSIPEKLINGQFTRMSIRFTIDDAYLFSVPFMDNWKVEYSGDIEIQE